MADLYIYEPWLLFAQEYDSADQRICWRALRRCGDPADYGAGQPVYRGHSNFQGTCGDGFAGDWGALTRPLAPVAALAALDAL